MTTMCKLFLALGFSHLSCEPQVVIELPIGDADVFEYVAPVREQAEAPELPEPPESEETAPVEEEEPPEVRVEERIVHVERNRSDLEETQARLAPSPPATGFDVAAVERVYRSRLLGGLGLVVPPPAERPGGGRAAAEVLEEVEVAAAGSFPPPSRYLHPGLAGGEPVDNARILTEDRSVTGILETSINTQLDGSVIIQTSRDVFGYHGQRILLAKGSRMVCDYAAPKKIGEHRVGLTCDRVLTAEHRAEIHEVAAPGGDVQGRSGVTGDVDNRFLESYGSAFVLTFISASVRAAVASARDSGSDDTDDLVVSEAGEEISTRFGEITASVLQRTLNLKPIITVPQGTRVQIRPASDWYIKPAAER